VSTKALRAALQQASSWGCVDGVTDSPCAHCAVVAARAELEAIERAAKALDDGPPGVINDKAIDAWLEIGESIAKDAK
jgi:hypothetical protein